MAVSKALGESNANQSDDYLQLDSNKSKVEKCSDMLKILKETVTTFTTTKSAVEQENNQLLEKVKELESSPISTQQEKVDLTELSEEMDRLQSEIGKSKKILKQKDQVIKELKNGRASRKIEEKLKSEIVEKDSKIEKIEKNLKKSENKTREIQMKYDRKYENYQNELEKNIKEVRNFRGIEHFR